MFVPEKYDAIYNRIRYLIEWKLVSHVFLSLLRENQSSFLRFFAYRKEIDIAECCKSVLNEDRNHYLYNKFLEKCLYQLANDNDKKILIGW